MLRDTNHVFIWSFSHLITLQASHTPKQSTIRNVELMTGAEVITIHPEGNTKCLYQMSCGAFQ